MFLVREETSDDRARVSDMFNVWPLKTSVMYEGERDDAQRNSLELLSQIVDRRLNPKFAALKLLHRDDNARDPERARDRATREIEAMRSWQHPHLLALKDFDGDELWYVSEFHGGGTLDHCLTKYQGNLNGTLTAIRPLVEGVALLHKHNVVHRDIKPHNIFIASDGRLVLGDFGLIYLPDPQNSRISATHSNVGTHAWMPAWAMEHRVAELRPTFDVFSLGKVMWAMLSGKPVLNLWYYDRPQNNVESQFPNNPEMRHANELFAKCVVENEEQCITSANEFLEEIDKAIETVARGPNFFESPRKLCKVCHVGEYVQANPREGRNFGLNPGGEFMVLIYICNRCRNVELFYINQNDPQPDL